MVSTRRLKNFEANIDIKKTVAIRPFFVTDGDTGNVLTLNVYDGELDVDVSGCFVNAVFVHKRGISSQDSDDGSVSVLGNVVTIQLDPASFSPGLVECELQIYSGEGDGESSYETLITSARFSFTCRNAILNGDSITSVTQFPVLTRLIDSVTSAEEARESAEAARIAAEAGRAEAEAARAAAESSRASAEAGRTSAEAAREAAEAQREAGAVLAASAASAANAAASAANSAAANTAGNIAAAFDAEESYAIGDHVSYNGLIYRCTAAHTGAWDADHFRRVTVGQELEALRDIAAGGGYGSAADVKRLVTLGQHYAIPVGGQFETSRETALAVAIGRSTGITAAGIDEEAFLAAVHEAGSKRYRAVFDGSSWRNGDGEVIVLADYGVTVTGSPREGDTVYVTETASKILLDVADHDINCGTDEQDVMLVTHDIVSYNTIPFSAPQLLFTALQALPAGAYVFSLDHGAYGGVTGQDGTYRFVTTETIPAGGGIRHSAVGRSQPLVYRKNQITGGTVTTYGAGPEHTVIETGIAVTEWQTGDSGTQLGTVTARDAQYKADTVISKVNYSERSAHGSNRYAHSCLRKWLNSNGKAVKGADPAFSYWWTPSDEFDMPPEENVRKMAGFLHGLDPDLVENIGEATIVVGLPAPERASGGGDAETLHDKVFPLSFTEVFGEQNNSVNEGEQLAVYVGSGSSAKIKLSESQAQNWQLRSPYVSTACANLAVSYAGKSAYHTADTKKGAVGGMIIKAPKV